VCLSSIFNFESLSGFKPQAPKTLLAVAGVVALLELGVRLLPVNALLPGRQAEMRFLETEVLQRFPPPRIIFLGSSRIRRAANPRLLDEALGLPRHSTMNLGLAGGRVFEALYFYEQHLDALKSAEVVVLALDEWHLSTGWRLGSVYEMNAPWSERLSLPDPLRTRLMLDGLFNMRLNLRLLPPLLKKGGLRARDATGLVLTDDYQVLPKAREKTPPDLEQHFQKIIDTYYDQFSLHPVMEGHVEAIARRVKQNGGRLVLLQLPNRAGYQNAVERTRGKEYQQHREALQRLAGRLDVPLYFYRLPEECGLDEQSFEDYGHLNPEGAKNFTRFFAPILKKHMEGKQ
jgi:hypothetical protein